MHYHKCNKQLMTMVLYRRMFRNRSRKSNKSSGTIMPPARTWRLREMMHPSQIKYSEGRNCSWKRLIRIGCYKSRLSSDKLKIMYVLQKKFTMRFWSPIYHKLATCLRKATGRDQNHPYIFQLNLLQPQNPLNHLIF